MYTHIYIGENVHLKISVCMYIYVCEGVHVKAPLYVDSYARESVYARTPEYRFTRRGSARNSADAHV